MEAIRTELQALSQEGGWLFWALIALAFGIGFAMMTIWRSLSWRDAPILSSRQWNSLFKSWQDQPELIQQLRTNLVESGNSGVEQVEKRLFAKARRRIPFAFVLIGAAPLVGLLGTVSGMMSTFSGMAAGGDAPIDAISRGISEALITTQTGLIIAVPAFLLATFLKSRLDQKVLVFRRIEAEVLKSLPQEVSHA